MRWQGRRQSENVEDQRGMGPVGGGGMLGGRGVRVGGFGIGGTLIILLLGLVFGFDPSFLLNGGYVDEAPAPRSSTTNPGTHADRAFGRGGRSCGFRVGGAGRNRGCLGQHLQPVRPPL